MKLQKKKLITGIYVVGTFLLMTYYQHMFISSKNWEYGLSFVIIMGLLVFPISIVALALGPFLGALGIIVNIGEMWNIPLAWIFLATAGYLQWFIAVPKLILRLKKWRLSRRGRE